MRQVQQLFVNLVNSRGFNRLAKQPAKDSRVFERKDIPFAFDAFNNRYTLNHNQIAYRMPETLANSLCKWHTKQYQKEHLSYPDVTKWYEQLTDVQRKKVKRYDYNNKRWLP